MSDKFYWIQFEMVTFGGKREHLGILLKFLLIFFGIIYIFRAIFPVLFKVLISNWIQKNKQRQSTPSESFSSGKKQSKSASDTMGEYIDYEEVE
ncbi:MAG: hypothetical protein VW080_05890 [Flavobacteriaceae bacterium]